MVDFVRPRRIEARLCMEDTIPPPLYGLSSLPVSLSPDFDNVRFNQGNYKLAKKNVNGNTDVYFYEFKNTFAASAVGAKDLE